MRGMQHAMNVLVRASHIMRYVSFASLFLRLAPFVLFLLSLSVSVSSGENKPIQARGPIVITSASLTADNKAHTALFEGSVIAKTDTMTIYSDKMLVYYSEAGAVTRIDSEGHVKVITGERVITSAVATYFAEEDKVVFTGEPRATEGGN